MFDPTVLMIGWEYPPNNSGGLGVACEGLTKALATQNTEIYFTLPYHHGGSLQHVQLLTCADPAWETETSQPPFSVYGVQSPVTVDSAFPINANELHALPTSQLEQRVDDYARLVLEQTKKIDSQVDIIHAHDWMTFPAATQLSQATGKPMVAHIHSTEFDRIPGGNGSPYIHHQEYQGMKLADRVIVVSYYTKKILVDKYLIDPNKIDVVHNGVFPLAGPYVKPSPQFAQKRPVVVFMGRLTFQKGAEYFLAVAKKVLATAPDTLFIVAGHGDQYYQLLVSAAGQSLSASVLFTGFIRGREKNQLLDRADVFLMPSLSEPFGLVALEAAQRQTPVIVSKTAGVSEVMSSALAIDFWDVDKMSQSILEVLANRAASQRQVTRQLRDLEKITWKKAALDVKQVYRRAFLG